MNATIVGVLAFAGISAATLVGMRLRAVLPEHHLSTETKDTVRLGIGWSRPDRCLGREATAKGSYDTERGHVILMAGKVGYLEEASLPPTARKPRRSGHW